MGSWNVYCEISNITIPYITNENIKCILLPIRKNKYNGNYIPATLPIFGSYNDCGQITDIEKDFNVEIIESYFNCTIEQFCLWFTNELHYGNNIVKKDMFTNFEELKEWDFMYIKREVYEFLSEQVKVEYNCEKLEIGHLLGVLDEQIHNRIFNFQEKTDLLTVDNPLIFDKFFDNFELLKEDLIKLFRFNNNLPILSKTYTPFKPYITAFDAEYELHQKILEQFIKINKIYID